MSQRFFFQGIQTARSRTGLAALLYAMNLVVGLILSVPLYVALSSATSTTGYSPGLSKQFDITLWADIVEKMGPVISGLVSQLFWMVPLYMLWKIVSSVGVIHTVHSDGNYSFWQGIGRYAGKAILLGLMFLVPLAVILIAVAVVIFALSAIFSGEVGTFWIMVVLLPITGVLGVALVDMMHDFARMELVIGQKPVADAWLAGIRWPFRYAGANTVYVSWFIVAIVVTVLPLVADFSIGGLWLVFLVQQVMLFVRATVTVGWYASEASYFDAVQESLSPLIAGTDEVETVNA